MVTITGKTYSLFSDSQTSDSYFQTVKEVADSLLEKFHLKESEFLQIIKAGPKKKLFGTKNQNLEFITDDLKNHLSQYIPGVKHHLKTMSLVQRFDATLRTKEVQYYLYMIEIELMNRINKAIFKQANFKMALFPHCLSDFRPRCISKAGDVEHICQDCTKDCHINLGSKLLREHGIAPYISVTIDQKRLFQELKNRNPGIGVIGIACIPELARGMRLCQGLGIAAIGIPLDANRCARWMGKAYETSFNLKELKNLIQQFLKYSNQL